MGFERIFSNLSNFAGFSDTNLNMEPIYVSKFIQKVYMDVNEKGETMYNNSGLNSAFQQAVSVPFDFTADHPFIFIVKLYVDVLIIGKFVY